MSRADLTDHAPRGGLDAEPEGPRVSPDDPASDAVRAALGEGLHWLRLHRPHALDGDPRGVHQLRVTTRRLRSTLALFRDLTEPVWADGLADELKWVAAALGAVRDLDVLAGRFRAAEADLSPDSDATLRPLFDDLAARHAEASTALRETLAGERFRRFESDLTLAAAEPPLADEASTPCRDALPRLVEPVWKTLKHSGRDLDPDDPDEAFHAVRKQAKRARYAADAVRGALDDDVARDAARFARRAKRVQEVLGAHQDAAVAAVEVRRVAERHPGLGPFNFLAGRLLEREYQTAAATRLEFFDVWRRLDRKKIVRWLKD